MGSEFWWLGVFLGDLLKKGGAFIGRLLLKWLLVPIAVVVIIVEEWFWNRLLPIMRRVGQWPGFRQVETWIRGRGKGMSLFLFVFLYATCTALEFGLPVLLSGHLVLTIASVLFVKIVGSAGYVWVYHLTEPRLIEFGWVRKTRDWIVDRKNRVHDWTVRQPFYGTAKDAIKSLREAIAKKRQEGGKFRTHFRAIWWMARSERRKNWK